MKIMNNKNLFKSSFFKGDVRPCLPTGGRTGGLNGFTLIETLVTVGVLAIMMVTVGGILFMSFKSKNLTDINELMSSKAIFILGELKKNVLDAQTSQIVCPDINIGIGNSISFRTKSGGVTTLLCDEASGQIASRSANGTNYFLENSIKVVNCQNFTWCKFSSESKVLSVGFTLNFSMTGSNGVGLTGLYYGEVTPRE